VVWDFGLLLLTEQIFTKIRSLLEEKRLLLKSGTIVDATVIAAPPSTKNEQGARDPEMRQTKKGKDWHFGLKAHIGSDRHGIVHSLSATAANVSDITQMPKLLHGQEREVFGDQAYWNESHRKSALAAGIRYRINRRSPSVMSHKKLIRRVYVQELYLAALGESIWARVDHGHLSILRRRNERTWKPSWPHAACRTAWCGARI
jgi:transposase, IS5 family